MATITIQTRCRTQARELLKEVFDSCLGSKWTNRKTSVVADNLTAKIVDDHTVEISSEIYTENMLTYNFCNKCIY